MKLLLILLLASFLKHSDAQMDEMQQGGNAEQWNWVITIENWLIEDIYIAETKFDCMQKGDVRKTKIVARTGQGPTKIVFKTHEDSCFHPVRKISTRGLTLAFKSYTHTFLAMYHFVEMRSWFATRICNIYSSSKMFFTEHSVCESVVIGCGDKKDSSGTRVIEVRIRVKHPGPIFENSKPTRNINQTMYRIETPGVSTPSMVYTPPQQSNDNSLALTINNLSPKPVYVYMAKGLKPYCMEVRWLDHVITIKPSTGIRRTMSTKCGTDKISELYFILSLTKPKDTNDPHDDDECWAIGYLAIDYKEGRGSWQRVCNAASGNTKPNAKGESLMFDAVVDYCQGGGPLQSEYDDFYVTIWP